MFSKKNVKNIYALTPTQEGMLFQSLYDNTSSAYFEQFNYHISGRLNVHLFEQAWNEVIHRHDSLRTIFVYKNVPQPLQIVLKERKIDFYFEDIHELSEQEQQARWMEYREKEKQKQFDLSRDILMRITVFQCSDTSFFVTWSFHHILLDGWSAGIIYEELTEIYSALLKEEKPFLKPVIPFSQYIKWLKKQDTEIARNYWQEYLKDYYQLTSLPHIPQKDKRFVANVFEFELNETITVALKQLAFKYHVTVNTLIQVIWGILLGLYNETGDILFGSTVSGRPPEINGIENMVGLFINAIPVRIRISSKDTFRSVLQKVQQEATEGRNYHYYSLADIFSETALKQNLFDHILVFENYPNLEVSKGKLKRQFVIDSFESSDHTHFDLSVQIFPETCLKFELIYNQSVYDAAIIENIEPHLNAIIKAILENEELEIKTLDILSAQERAAYLHARDQRSAEILLLPDRSKVRKDRKNISTPYAQTENEDQEKLLTIWTDILNIDFIGIDDNYFELGGHSLAALRILSRIHQIFETEVSLKDFFNHPNIRALSKLIWQQDVTPFEDIKPLPEQPDYEVSHSQRRLWILDKLEENFVAYNLSAGYLFEGEFDIPAFQRAVKNVIARHESLRTTFVEVNGEPRQRVGSQEVELEVRSQESGVRSQESGVRSQEIEVRSQESGVRSQEIEVRSQESGVRSQESEVGSQESSPITSHQLPITSHQLPITSHQLPITSHLLPITSHPSPITSHLLPITSHLEIIEYAKAESQRPFDLEKGALFRISILKLDEDRHVVLLNIHHIIFDEWSFSVLASELLYLYQSEIQNSPPLTHHPSPITSDLSPLTPLKIQYKDYAAWHNQLLASDAAKVHQEYWHDKLSGELPVLNLPTDYPRPPVQTYKGISIRHILEKEITANLKALCRKKEVTLFMALLSVVKVLIYRYTEQNDIIIASPIAGRNHKELENQIGFFVNTLALRDTINGDETFEMLLSKVKQTTIEAYEHQLYPFDRLVEELNIQRDISRSPIFDVMMVLRNNGSDRSARLPCTPNLKISPFKYETGVSPFDLTFIFTEEDETLNLEMNYNKDLFRSDTIERMGTHFEELLRSILNDEKSSFAIPISHLNILSKSEKEKLLIEFNYTKEYPKDKTIVDLFEEQVERTPDNRAIIFEDKKLTYQELNQAANNVAYHLKDKYQVQADDLVAVLAERNEEMIIGLLGILKAGAAYLPIDPAYPKERINYILEDSNCKVILETESEDAGRRAQISNFKSQISNHKFQITNFKSQISNQSLAYVIYTSGSTGNPKGVMIEHGGFVNMIMSQISGFGISESDRVLQFSSPSFDASLSEIFMALLKGAALVMIRKKVLDDPKQFLKYIAKHQVSVITFPPVYLNMLNKDPLPTLRTIITAGEPPIMSDALFYCQEKNYFNAYGPTETSVCASFYKVPPMTHDLSPLTSNLSPLTYHPSPLTLPIGNPIPNLSAYILDDALNLVPIGVPGELCFSGVGLARGYLNRPDLTAEKFIDNPVSPGNWLYKTGDMARWLADGNIEFLGRKDNQIKVRGYRIESGEIKATLLQHSGIRDAVVIAKENKSGNKQLTAFFIPYECKETLHSAVYQERKASLYSSELRRYLRSKIPEYMIPSAFWALEEIPLTPNGKVDQNALLKIENQRAESRKTRILPRNPVELQLINIWERILEIHPIEIQDNFFDLGGNSLSAIQLMSQIQQKFGISLPIAQLFQHPDIEKLASMIQNRMLQCNFSTPFQSLVEIQPNGTKPPFFFVPGVGGNVFYLYNLSRYMGKDYPFYGLQAKGLDGKTEPLTSIEAMAAHYIKEIQEIQAKGPYFLGGHSIGGWVAFEMAQQLHQKGEKIAFLSLMDTIAPHTDQRTSLSYMPDNATLLVEIAESFGELYGKSLDISYRMFKGLSPEEELRQLKNIMEEARIFAPDSDISQIRGLVKVMKANLKIRYVPKEIYPGQITLFRAEENVEGRSQNSEFRIQESETRNQKPAWNWDLFSSKPVEIHFVPGNHHTMMAEPHVKALAEKIKFCFNRN